MGVKCVKLFAFYLCSLCICITSYPVEEQTANRSEITPEPVTGWRHLLALAFTVTCVLVLLGCLNCCKQRAGFKEDDVEVEFRNDVCETNANSVGLDFVNPLQNVTQPSRYSIFSSIVEATIEKQPESVVTFEPLPNVLPNKFANLRLPQFNGNANDIGFIEDWLGDKDFPRQQLHYLRECGQGWFGKVVEGEARGILPSSNKVHRVVVRILKEDATGIEQAHFLREAKPYKDLSHPNVLKLLGRCLENVPFLLVFETCSNGDLKSYLRQNIGNRDALIFQGIILRMAVDAAAGLSYMLQHGFVHTDIAARNCLVTADLRVKIGDYGISLQTYKDEYFVNEDVAIPIRWCAPETISCRDNSIEPRQITGSSCIWSYGVLLWELEEWGELPYKELTNEEVIAKVFGTGYRLPYPANRTPYTQEMYDIMQECWKDYVDRPSFIHVMNALAALMHRFKNNDFDTRWQSSKPNTIPITDNEDRYITRLAALAAKADNDSGIDLDNPKALRGLSMLQLQQSSSRQRIVNDELSSESPASSRRFSNSSTGDLFSSPISMKHRSPSLENLHGSLDNIGSLNRRMTGDEVFGTSSDFQLGLVSHNDASILWNNKPLFHTDSYLEDNSITKRIDSLGTDAEEEIWRKRIERGEFTEKVKEKSKSVADLMILTHIECSESSESDSLPSFHSRQSSFNRQCRRASKGNVPLSLLNSLSFGSESNLPAVEKDQEFQEALKKIQIAKLTGDEDSLNLVSLPSNSLVIGRDENAKIGHFLANEASEKCLHSSHIGYSYGSGGAIAKLPLFNNLLDREKHVTSKAAEEKLPEVNESLPVVAVNAVAKIAQESMLEITKTVEAESLPEAAEKFENIFETRDTSVSENKISVEISLSDEPLQTNNCSEEETTDEDGKPTFLLDSGLGSCEMTKDQETCSSSYSENEDSVVLGPSECYTLECFKGLKTTLVDEKTEPVVESFEQFECPRTLNEFLNDTSDDYFYKCDEVPRRDQQYCDYCYAKCHFSNECLRCKDKSLDENCSCESFENLEKFRDCAALNSCPFQSDDSGRGTDQINSGDGSSDKSLEGSISVQMNEVKNRLEDVIAKFVGTNELSDDNCSSLEDDKDDKYTEESTMDDRLQVTEELVIEEIQDATAASTNEFKVYVEGVDDVKTEDTTKDICGEEVELIESPRRDSLFVISEENENSASCDEDTCIGTGVCSSHSSKGSEEGDNECDSKDVDDKSNSSRTFVKVESLFFSVDPKFEKEIEAEMSKSSDSFSKLQSLDEDSKNEDITQAEDINVDGSEQLRSNPESSTSLHEDRDHRTPNDHAEYDITDILEGLSEPISLPYSVNRPAKLQDDQVALSSTVVSPDDDNVSSSWLPSPIENDDEHKHSLHMDQTFVEAIRNELREKLPSSSTPAVVESEEACTENANITIEYNAYPAQLSPIFEEEECSSLSSARSVVSSNGESSDTINGTNSFGYDGEDVLVVNTETNEASILEHTPNSCDKKPHQLNETYEIDENDDTIGLTDTLDSDSFPSPDSLSPGTSSKTGAQLSCSSSECGNLSDVFLSPSSSKNFDEFDLEKLTSSDDSRHLNTPENKTDDCQKAIFNIEEMLRKSEGDDETRSTTTVAPGDDSIDPVRRSRDETWLKSLFMSNGEPSSLTDGRISESSEEECWSLPPNFKTEDWPSVDELQIDDGDVSQPCDVNCETEKEEESKTLVVDASAIVPGSENDVKQVEESIGAAVTDDVTCHTSDSESLFAPSTNLQSSQSAKKKNSLALFGNTTKQIRNFQVSVVEEDCLKSKTLPTTSKNDAYLAERLNSSTSPKSSEKTWKSSLNSFLNNQNLEMLGVKEISVNDMLMSTSFIESGSQEGSVDGKEDNESKSEDSDDEGVESTSEEFVWKKNETDVAQIDESKTDTGAENNEDDEEDDDDEELTDFVPFSWNSGAIPQRSALKVKDRMKAEKKNVSFKKQKYHCVYEYPKEEPNYPRRYDNILHERMFNFWNLNQDYLYKDYASFSDWELDDCDEQFTCNDDLLPYPGTSGTKPGLNRLGFYTFGSYEMDSNTRNDDVSLTYSNFDASSPLTTTMTTISSTGNSPIPSPAHVATEGFTENTASVNGPEGLAHHHREFTFENIKTTNVDKNPSSNEAELLDLPSPGLGELRHTKSRLKLDLPSRAAPYKPEIREKCLAEDETGDENATKNDNYVKDFALNYKACDLSPVVELKPLTSTSVA